MSNLRDQERRAMVLWPRPSLRWRCGCKLRRCISARGCGLNAKKTGPFTKKAVNAFGRENDDSGLTTFVSHF